MTAPTGLVLARTEPIGRELYSVLRQRLITGVLKPGDAISEVQMAEEMGVSRTPVREVFRRLADEGFLRILPQVEPLFRLFNFRPSTIVNSCVRRLNAGRSASAISARRGRMPTVLEDFLALQRVPSVKAICTVSLGRTTKCTLT